MLEWVVTSAALCALVAALRYLLRGKISLRLQYALWGLVLLRLLLPVSFGSSSLSIMNALPGENMLLAPVPAAEPRPSPAEVPLPAVTPVPASPGTLAPTPRGEARPVSLVPETAPPAAEPERTPPDAGRILRLLWTAGTGALLLWFAGVNLRFARKLRRSRERFAGAEDFPLPVYVTPAAETPCLFGLFRPAVYLPPEAADDPSLGHILAHELTHLRHGDQVWSLLRSLALALHWFDPLVWWAAFLSRRDGELACDEGTLRQLGEGERGAYGRTLLRMTCASRPALFRAATTMTGSKRGLKERIRLIARKPKTVLLALVALVLIAALGAACTFTGAKKPVEYNDEWFAETAWSYAEEYAKANSLSIRRDNYLVLPHMNPEVEVCFPVENTRLPRTLAVTLCRAEDGTWAVPKGLPVQDILRDRLGFVVEAEVPDAEKGALNCAMGCLTSLTADWNDGYPPWSGDYTANVNRIWKARITGLTPMGVGTQGLTEGQELYRLEYRLLPEDQVHIDLPEGMRTEVIDGETWITEWSGDGQPYLLLRWKDWEGDPELDPDGEPVWTLAGKTNTRELEEVYGSPEMLEKYGDAYTAAAAELYAAYLAGENAPSVRLNREDFTLVYPGDSFQMTVEIPPALRNATVSWFSKDPNVATVSQEGLVTAVDHGTTKIDVWVGMAKAQCTVRVSGYAAGAPADRDVEISFEPRDVPEGIREMAKLHVLTLIEAWNDGVPNGDGTLTANANPIVSARITGVTPVWKGTGDGGERRALYRLEYRLLPEDQEHIVFTEGMRAEFMDGQTWITEWGENGQPYLLFFHLGPDGDVEDVDGSVIGCLTSARELAEYDTPEMRKKYGDAYTAAAAELYAAKSKEARGRAISLQWIDVTLRVGESVLPLAGVDPSLAGERITWISGDPEVATVSEDGRVTAVNQGVTKIIASAGGYTAECTVRVHGVAPEPEQSGYDVFAQGQLRWVEEKEPAVWMPIENLVMVEGHSYPQIVEVSSTLQGKPISWISEDPDVAEVNEKGVITAVNPGTTKVTITVGEYSAECTVRVEKYPPDPAAETGEENGIILDRSVISLLAGAQYRLTPDLAPELSGTEVVWSSDDPEIAAVSPDGLVTAVGWGTTRVYAAAGDKVTDCVVMVTGYARRGLEEDGYPVNERGETYGGIKDLNGVTLEPDLEAAAGFTPEGEEIDGYVRTFDLYNGGPVQHPRSPAEALAYNAAMEELRREALDQGRDYLYSLPLYDKDGVTVIGYFPVGNV